MYNGHCVESSHETHQTVQNETVNKLGKLLHGSFEFPLGALQQLHGLLHAGDAVVGGGQAVERVGIVGGQLYGLLKVVEDRSQALCILRLQPDLTYEGERYPEQCKQC